MKITELVGSRLKKDLDLERAIKSYQNKHVDGSGNFGFVLRQRRADGTENVYSLYGDYDTEGTVVDLSFGEYISAGRDIPHDTYESMVQFLMEGVRA